MKVRLKPLLDKTIGTVFSQNWSLFAPNPVAQDYILLIQPLKGKTEIVNNKGWYNLSSTFWKHFQHNRFSAYDRLARSQTNALRNAISGDARLMVYLDACEKGDTSACRVYKQSLSTIRKSQIDKLVKIGSAFCNDVNVGDHNYNYFAIRVRIVSFPSWSKRYTAKKTIRDFDLGIHSIDKKTTPFGLFN